jgi:protein O-GlcNAc transferase
MTTNTESIDLAYRYHVNGELAQAERIYRQILALDPNQALVVSNLGAVLQATGRGQEAWACWKEAVRLNPSFANAHNNLGGYHKEQRQWAEAIACYRQALRLEPNHVDAHYNLGVVLQEEGQIADAIESFLRVVQINPGHADAYNNLGSAFFKLGRHAEAIEYYGQALRVDPNHAGALNNLGGALHAQGRVTEAIRCYRQALYLNPNYATAFNNLGTALFEQWQYDDACQCFQNALQLNPQDHAYRLNLVHIRQHLCLWENQAELARQVIEGVEHDVPTGTPAAPFSFMTLPTPTTPGQQLQCARKHARSLSHGQRVALAPRTSTPRRGGKSKITLGYLSAGFLGHPMAYLTAELFEKHDRENFEVLAYSYSGDDGSDIRRRLVAAFDRFHDVRELSALAAAQRIAADEVDILIDLQGYTGAHRTAILALQPAPIQVQYLGYPGTMGGDFIDYLLVDDFIVPPGQQPYFTEHLVHLPGCYLVNDGKRAMASPAPVRAECGLPESGFVFCDFNNSYKITPEMFDIWMRLLKAVPGSVLWLLEGNRFSRPNLCQEAEARGVPTERLVFAPRCSMPEHLARHCLADLFLDTYPVCGHTTASESLWAGCPVLTMAGETFISRVAGSLLRSLGLSELVTTSFEEYEALALRLARDRDLLAEVRARLAVNRTTAQVFDSTRFTRNLEQAYRTMWALFKAGDKARPFSVIET